MSKVTKDDPFPSLPRRAMFRRVALEELVERFGAPDVLPATKPAEPPPVSNIAPAVSNNVSNKGDRVKAWRAKNPERYREQQRETMRKRRAAKRAS